MCKENHSLVLAFMLSTKYSKRLKRKVVVNLDGQGADEMLAGYYGYPHARFESLIKEGKFVDIFKLWKELGNTFGNKPNKALIQSCSLTSMRNLDHGEIKILIENF